MLVSRLIERKRNDDALSSDEWAWLIAEYTQGNIPDYQMSALLMASFLNGLVPAELSALVDAMINSGDVLRFAAGSRAVDKHSTGGVGDKVSLVLVPLVASCGIPVPMISGRGLGHTAGTLDKLEAIPGFRTGLTLAEAKQQVESIGCVMIGQTGEVAPADRKLYALRDATATVGSIPLMSASIMSKKLCEGISGLVLDVKYGSGAFVPETERAIELAQTMIGIGEHHGCRTVALLTVMDRPLGRACGNALETREALEALKGNGPADLMEVTIALAVEMMLLGRVAENAAGARQLLVQAIENGKAADKFREVITAQGGNASVIDNYSLLPNAACSRTFEASRSGFISQIEPRAVGYGIVEMGGGRSHIDDTIDFGAGFEFAAVLGSRVEKGQAIATVYASDNNGLDVGCAALETAVKFSDEEPDELSRLVSHRIDSDGVTAL